MSQTNQLIPGQIKFNVFINQETIAMQRGIQRSKIMSALTAIRKIKRSFIFLKDGLEDIKILHHNMKQQINDKIQWNKSRLADQFANPKNSIVSIKIDANSVKQKIDKQNSNPNSYKPTVKSFMVEPLKSSQNQTQQQKMPKIQLFKDKYSTDIDFKFKRNSVPTASQYSKRSFSKVDQQKNSEPIRTIAYQGGHESCYNLAQRVDTTATSKYNSSNNRDLKDKIIQELLDLKAIDRKLHSISKTNERIYECYSENKSRLKQSSEFKTAGLYPKPIIPSKSVMKENKQNLLNVKFNTVESINERYKLSSLTKSNKENRENYYMSSKNTTSIIKTSKALQQRKQNINQPTSIQLNSTSISKKNIIVDCQTQENQPGCLMESQVTIKIEAPIKSKRQRNQLKCTNNHEYYNGQVINLNSEVSPHGSGNLVFCCRKMPLMKEVQKQVYKKSGLSLYQKYQFYNGNFAHGKFDGYGTLAYKGQGQVKYVGQFKQGKRNGKGSLYCNGKIQVGIWKNDQFIKSL